MFEFWKDYIEEIMKKVFIKNLFESIYLLIDICILSIVIILKLPNIKNISKEKIKVVTGASSSHFKSLLQFLIQL